MGLCNSSGMHRVAPPSGCPAVDVCFKKSCHFVEFDTKAKFTPDRQHFVSNKEEWFEQIKSTGDKENLRLLASIPEVNANGDTKTIDGYRSDCFNVYTKTKDTVDTISVYAVSIFDSTDVKGLKKGRKRTQVDGLTKAIEEYGKKGYELVALSAISSEVAATKYVVSCHSLDCQTLSNITLEHRYRQFKLTRDHRIQLFECIFQKVGSTTAASSNSSSIIYEASVECAITLMGIDVKTPDLNPLLQKMAADSYDLSSIAVPPMVLDSDKASSVLPIYMVFKKSKSTKP